MAKSTGEIAKTIGIEIQRCGVKSGETIAKGDFVTIDTNNDVLKATAGTTTISDGFAVALEASTSADPANINIAVGNTYVYVEAGGAIDGLDLVELEDTQEVILHGEPADAGTTPTGSEVNAIKEWYGFTVGRYFGKEGDTEDISAAADGETCIVRLGL